MDFSRLLLLFFFYSFAGWCTEVVFAAATYGKFINRGFLNGPVCPIYGYGILMVAVLLRPFQDSLALLFLGSALLTTAVEFLVGWGSERILHVRLWDYRRQPFNLLGYVCLKFSLLWGLACVFILRLIHPAAVSLAERIADGPALVLDLIFSLLMLADLIVTTIEALTLPRRLRALEEAERKIRAVSDCLGENLSGGTLSLVAKGEKERAEFVAKYGPELEALKAKRDAIVQQRNFVHDRLIRAFPAIGQGEQGSLIEKIRKRKE